MLKDKYEHLQVTLRDVMEREQLQALVTVSPENVLHTSGVYIVSQRMIRERLAITVYPRVGAPFFVVSSVVARTASNQSWIEDVVVWTEHESTPIEALVESLRDRGLTEGPIGLEKRYLAAEYYELLVDALPLVTWSDTEVILDRSRMVKTSDEVDLMRRNALQAEKAIYAGFLYSKIGTTERQIADRMRISLLELGGDDSPFMSLATGSERTLASHAVPGGDPLEEGDIVAVDMVGTWKGYYSDFARMAVVGEPSAEQRKAWKQVVEVQRQVIDNARPGVRANDLYHATHRYAEEAGFEIATNLVGHSLGIALHEYPHLNAVCEEELQPGMTLCIEILAKHEGLGRFHIEDLIEVRDGPARRLTTYFDTSEMYVIQA